MVWAFSFVKIKDHFKIFTNVIRRKCSGGENTFNLFFRTTKVAFIYTETVKDKCKHVSTTETNPIKDFF